MLSPSTQLMTMSCVVTHVERDAEAVDEYGNPLDAEEPETTTTRCYLAQSMRAEVGLAPVEKDRWTLYLPADVEIDADDSVACNGRDYQVIGDPWVVISPVTGASDHIEATLERTG
jgi:hypothetical protein